MTDGEGINFKVTIRGKSDRKPSNLNPLTLQKLFKWIDDKPAINVEIKEELKKMASTYPQQALTKWQLAFPKHLIKARETLANKDVFIIKPPRKEENGKENNSGITQDSSKITQDSKINQN